MTYKYSSQVESEYGLKGPLAFDQIHNGPDNDVFIVTDFKNTNYVLRQSKRLGKNAMFEMEVLTKLAQVSFLSPEPLQTKSKAFLINIDKIQLVLFTYIKGTQIPQLGTEHLETDVIERGAKKLGELHSLTKNIKVSDIPSRTIFTEYDRLLALDMEKLKPFKDFEILLDQVKDFYSKAESRIKGGKELYGVIHNDYGIQNLIYIKDDCYIIDFDWACYGPLLKDLGLAVAIWPLYSKDGVPSRTIIDRFLKSYNETAPQTVAYDKDLIFWVCFACLSDTCTFITDTVQNNYKYGEKAINDVEQCRMYKKFEYFYKELKNK
jgi:Ser/Thr protein kinase RdoA (MazF antagonist)